MFTWEQGWDGAGNNDSRHAETKADIIKILKTATKRVKGDNGLKKALAAESSDVTIVKGVHEGGGLHITVDYYGGRWHVGVGHNKDGELVVKAITQG